MHPLLREYTLKVLLSAVLLCSFSLHAEVYDKTEELYNVGLKSHKENDVRKYIGSTFKNLPYGIDVVKKGITNFTEKCNNDYQSKRKFTDEKVTCKYHNDQLIETFVVSDAKFPNDKTTEQFLLGRRVYNRGTYEFYDLVQVKEGTNNLQQRTVTVTIKMLENDEVKQLTEVKMNKDTAFDKSEATFVLTEVSQGETSLQYQYQAETSHWLLNKEIIVPQVFASISKGMNDIVTSIEQESSAHKRNVASK